MVGKLIPLYPQENDRLPSAPSKIRNIPDTILPYIRHGQDNQPI
jgi:hypothetical protein